MSTTVVGIDIGSVSVRAVEVKNAHTSNPTLVRFHEVPLTSGAAHRGEVLDVREVASALRKLWAGGGFKSRNIILGMGGPRVLSRDLVVPATSRAQIREALPFQVQELLPYPVADALLDFYPISQRAGDNGSVVNGLLVAVIKEAVVANVAAVTQARLRTVQVDLTPFALARALAPIRNSTGLIAIVSIGASSTNVIVVDNGIPQFVRIIAAGGEDITAAIATQLQVTRTRAEEIKMHSGLGASPGTADAHPTVRIIQEATNHLLVSLRDSLNYYLQSHPQSKFEKIVLSGGGSRLAGLAAAMGQITAISVVQGSALAGVKLSSHVKSRLTPDKREAMTTAFALALGTTV